VSTGGSWAPCTSPHTTAALDDGSHTFDVRATDAAGNTDGTPASHTWSIDLGPPSVTITGADDLRQRRRPEHLHR
jgi:hypothetical protein